MQSNKQSCLHQRLYESFRKCHPLIKPLEAQNQVNEEWRSAKELRLQKNEFENLIERRIKKYLEGATKKKSKNILSFFKAVSNI